MGDAFTEVSGGKGRETGTGAGNNIARLLSANYR